MGRGAVGRLRVRAVDLESGRTWWGLGRARWTPVESDPTACDVREEGVWLSGPSRGAPFRGGYRWAPAAGGLVVSHLRRGADAPVALVRLVPTGPGRLDSETPHVCGDDRYDLRAGLREDGLHLRWTIRGPRQRTRLFVRYRAATPAPMLQVASGIAGAAAASPAR